MGKTVVEVKNFSYQYNLTEHRALKNISFQVEEGSFFCIVGANGSGKSTLCNALVGLIPHYFVGNSAGSIVIDGVETTNHSIAELSEKIGLVFQNPFNQLSYTAGTVAEELAYGLGNRGVSREDMQKKIAYVAKLMRIEDICQKNPLELSGGQIQRVAFGSIFILEPNILVLDECTTQLDPLGSEEIFTIVKKLNENGITVIMVDHEMERVAKFADKVLVLNQGEVALIEEPYTLFTNHELSNYGLDTPDYVKITQALKEKGYVNRVEISKEPVVRLIKEALNQ